MATERWNWSVGPLRIFFASNVAYGNRTIVWHSDRHPFAGNDSNLQSQ